MLHRVGLHGSHEELLLAHPKQEGYTVNHLGLCSGVCIFGYGIAPFLFNFLLLELINPDDIDPIKLPDGRSIYSKEVI